MPANNKVKNYDPAEVSIIIGSHIVSGYADGTFVKFERNNDAFTRVSGADGEGTRAKSNDRSATMELTLMHTSESNDILTGFALADEVNNGGTFPVLMKDSNGTEKHASEVAWIRKFAPSERGKEASSTVWTIEMNEHVPFIGGNPAI